MNTKKMTFEEYADGQDHLATLFDEQYWADGYNGDVAFEKVLRWAKADGVTITDEDTVDYDKVLYNIYNAVEKGLS